MNQDHLDPESVAAWVDGSLDAPARAAAEAHAADCGRCQAVLAAMIRTEPVSTPKPSWLGASLRWLVPLATATAIAGIWILVSPGGAPPVTREAAAPAAEAPQAVSIPPAPIDAIAPSSTELQKREPAPSPAVSRDQATAKNEAAKNAAKAVPQPPSVAETVPLADRAAGEKPAPQTGAAPQQAQQSQRQAGQVQTQLSAPTPPAQGPPAPMPIARATPPPPAPTAPAAPPRADVTSQRDEKRLGAVAGGVQQAQVAAASASREVASPDLGTRWRYGPSAAIQRSTDGGKTWTFQPSGVATELLSASAPSSGVCWIVGRAGVVLLSTDGATWRRVPFPQTIDLQAVTAVDARTASVTAADGRVFRTTDGGLTWTR